MATQPSQPNSTEPASGQAKLNPNSGKTSAAPPVTVVHLTPNTSGRLYICPRPVPPLPPNTPELKPWDGKSSKSSIEQYLEKTSPQGDVIEYQLAKGVQDAAAQEVGGLAAGKVLGVLGRGVVKAAGKDGVFILRKALVKGDFPPIKTKVSNKQLRHIKGNKQYRGGGYMDNMDDAQAVLDAYNSDSAAILGKNSQGFPVVRVDNVTGTNVNFGSGFPSQPTNVFIIKGTENPSIVPANPNWKP